MLTALLAGHSSSASAPAVATPECQFLPEGYGAAGTVPIRVETVASGLVVPWGIAFLPDGDWLVTERPGRVRMMREGRLLPDPVMTVEVVQDGAGGLLGIAAHPRFADNRLFYIYVTQQESGQAVNRVIRYHLADDGRSAAFDRVIFDGIPAALYHDGGRIRFGPDGMLYVGTGDGGDSSRSPLLASLNGKLLRLDPDGGVPADNPYPRSPVFLLGLRDPEGFDWIDPRTLVITDHGPSSEFGLTGNDEVSVARAGADLGWPEIHGCQEAPGKVTPSLSWALSVPPGGAAIYTGDVIPEWKGSLLIGTLRSKHLHRVVFDPADPRRVTSHEVYLAGEYGRLREVAMGPDGALYVTTSNCDGHPGCPTEGDRILRITKPRESGR